jgi:hypothetical protein
MDGGSIIPQALSGIFDMSNEAYHATSAISKSGLWTLHTKSPAHYKFGESKSSATFDLGTAAHTAILEPEKLGSSILRGPEDRRGNKWKEQQEMAAMGNFLLLTAGDYDAVLRIRDAAHKNPLVRKLTAGAQVERSAFWMDEGNRPALPGPARLLQPELAHHGRREDHGRRQPAEVAPIGCRVRLSRSGSHVFRRLGGSRRR